MVPRAFGGPAGTAGTPITVMSVNMLVGGADASSIVDVVRSRSVDVLAVQELTPHAETELDAAGLAGLLPYRESHPELGASGSALYSRFPLTDGGGRVASPEGHGQAYAVCTRPGPSRSGSSRCIPCRRSTPTTPAGGRPACGPSCRPASGGPILAGDFNATLDHAELRRLLDTGYRDAASEVGDALAPTWPFHGPRAWLTPGHHRPRPGAVPGRRARVHGGADPGSDHRAIVATLLLPDLDAGGDGEVWRGGPSLCPGPR